MSATSSVEELPDFEMPLWAGLDPTARLKIRSELERVFVPSGETLFQEGDLADALYMLVTGALGISVRGHHGEQRRVGFFVEPKHQRQHLQRYRLKPPACSSIHGIRSVSSKPAEHHPSGQPDFPANSADDFRQTHSEFSG